MAMAPARALPSVAAHRMQPAGGSVTDSPQGAVPTGPTAFGRSLATGPGTVAHGNLPAEAPAVGNASFKALPRELLCLVFDYLPVSDHPACALVCRCWYDHLPDTRLRLARWLKKRTLLAPLWLSQSAGQIHEARIRPWLEGQSRPLRLAVERQYQEWLRLQDLPHSPGEHESLRSVQQRRLKAGFLLAVLGRYSLDDQLDRAPVLALRPVVIPDWDESDHVTTGCFSPCGLWMAMASLSDTEGGHTGLYIYGWQEGGWRKETLDSPMTDLVGAIRSVEFSKKGPGRLLVVQDETLVVWSRSQPPGHWSPEWLYRIPDLVTSRRLEVMDKGDLVLMCDLASGEGGRQVHFFPYVEEQQGWEEPFAYQYRRRPAAFCTSVVTNQLALGFVHPDHTAVYRNKIHIWRPGPGTAPSQPWYCQTCYLAPSAARLTRMNFSPDGAHLLGFMDNRQLVLWRVQPQFGLDEQLTTVCCTALAGLSLADQVPFRPDGGQLAVQESPGEIQLWNRAASGKWWPADRVLLHDSTEDSDDAVCRLVLPSDGRSLVCLYKHRVRVWCKDSRHQWQRQLERTNVNTQGSCVQVWLLAERNLIASYARDPELSLCLYSADAAGRLMTKARQLLPAPPFCRTPDGLSLLLGFRNGPPPITLQLVPPEVAPEDS